MKIRTLLLPALLLMLTLPSVSYAERKPEQQVGRRLILVLESRKTEGVSLVLTVYSDGGTALARKDQDNPEGELCTATVSAASLQTLQESLRKAGALHLQSQTPVPNASQKTVSFFAGDDEAEGAQPHGHTFVYFLRQEPYLTVETAILQFIAENFADCI